MYQKGLGFEVLGSFEDHEGFDGVMLGLPGGAYHFEFTHCRHHPVMPTPTEEDLIVLYFPDADEWREVCDRMLLAGFTLTPIFNPYWDVRGKTFADHDGYRVVIQNASWP